MERLSSRLAQIAAEPPPATEGPGEETFERIENEYGLRRIENSCLPYQSEPERETGEPDKGEEERDDEKEEQIPPNILESKDEEQEASTSSPSDLEAQHYERRLAEMEEENARLRHRAEKAEAKLSEAALKHDKDASYLSRGIQCDPPFNELRVLKRRQREVENRMRDVKDREDTCTKAMMGAEERYLQAEDKEREANRQLHEFSLTPEEAHDTWMKKVFAKYCWESAAELGLMPTLAGDRQASLGKCTNAEMHEFKSRALAIAKSAAKSETVASIPREWGTEALTLADSAQVERDLRELQGLKVRETVAVELYDAFRRGREGDGQDSCGVLSESQAREVAMRAAEIAHSWGLAALAGVHPETARDRCERWSGLLEWLLKGGGWPSEEVAFDVEDEAFELRLLGVERSVADALRRDDAAASNET